MQLEAFDLETGQASAVGDKELNEDFLVASVPSPALQESKGVAIVIADGLSGSFSGHEAAELAARGFINDYYSTPETWGVNTSVSRVLAALNGWLFRAQSDREAARATTLTILILKSSTAHIFHVGDSRITRLRQGQPETLTQEHRIALPSGESYLSRAVGIEPLLQVDYRRELLEPGDCFVLTTDGVHDALSEARLARLVACEDRSLTELAKHIVAEALAVDSSDNASCLIVRVLGIPSVDSNEFFAKLTSLPFPPARIQLIYGYTGPFMGSCVPWTLN